MKPFKSITDHRQAKALAHPIRLRILSILGQREASPSELSEELDVPLGNVAYHVRMLLSLDVIKLVRTTAVRGSVMHHYAAVVQPQFDGEVWEIEGIKQAALSTFYTRAGNDLSEALRSGGFSRSETHATRTPLKLDSEGWKQLSEAGKNFLSQIDEIGNASAERLKSGKEKGKSAMALVALFDTPSKDASDGKVDTGIEVLNAEAKSEDSDPDISEALTASR